MTVAGWVCRRCGNRFRVGSSMCPLCCGTQVDREEEVTVPHSRVADDYPENQPGYEAPEPEPRPVPAKAAAKAAAPTAPATPAVPAKPAA